MPTRLVLSLVSGLLMALAMPMQWGHWTPPNLGFLVWVALVPLMFAVRGLSPRRAYVIALPGTVLANALMLYWAYIAVHFYGHLGVITSIFVNIAGVVFLAAITALAPAVVVWIDRKRPHWWTWPLVWAAVEYARNFDPFLQGFTFCNLIHSQYQYATIFQIVNVVGPYWFLAIIVAVNVSVSQCIQTVCHPEGAARRICTWRSAAPLRMSALIFILLFSYGFYSRAHFREVTRSWPWLRVALLQGNIPQEEKWDSGLARHNFETYRDASVAAMASNPDLIVWPEASFPWVYDLEAKAMPRGHQLPQVPILMGSITREGDIYHNSAVLLGGDANYMDSVHKYHLVPFGEYIPYKKLLFFARRLTQEVGDLQPGPDLRPLELDGIPLGMLVCYEDTFPEIARTLVAKGSVLLVNITNDAWYGWSPAAAEHMAASVFRAVENGRYLVRATNTGVSAVVGPDGATQLASSLYEKATIISEVRLGVERTLYNRCGKWGDFSLIPFLLIAAGVSFYPRRTKYTP